MHRTFTHSFLFWFIVFVPLFIIFRLKSIPYFVAVVQHFAFGDLIMGKVMIFWPFNSSLVGFGFGMPSVVDVTLETAGLVLAAGIIVYSGDLRRLLSVDKRNILMLLPLLALIVSALFFASHLGGVTSLFEYVSSSRLLIILALGHLILVAFLTVSSFQGLSALKMRKKLKWLKSCGCEFRPVSLWHVAVFEISLISLLSSGLFNSTLGAKLMKSIDAACDRNSSFSMHFSTYFIEFIWKTLISCCRGTMKFHRQARKER